MSILLYGCTIRTLTKRVKEKLDSNYTRMLRAILNNFYSQHPTKQQLYGLLPPITKTIKVRRTRHAGYCWRNRDELISDILLWTPRMDDQWQDDQQEPTYNSSVPIHDVALNTKRKQWTIENACKRRSDRFVQIVWYDDDDVFLSKVFFFN